MTLAEGQRRGSITGTINPVNRGVVVVATNQVTSQVTNSETNTSGNYSLSLRPGAYRLSVEQPFTARFDKTKNYGEHA
ncbi:MAG TPA: carboxypeptidase-like regulatory domain-containing protein, partial [Pyrinomonadaceae bacterium]|nr:carboxypeptidase-like regulatory domain-containing protein [Pyrinomonadaceae bacterium]